MGAQEQGSPGLELIMVMALSMTRDIPNSKLFTKDPLRIKAGPGQDSGLPGLWPTRLSDCQD